MVNDDVEARCAFSSHSEAFGIGRLFSVRPSKSSRVLPTAPSFLPRALGTQPRVLISRSSSMSSCLVNCRIFLFCIPRLLLNFLRGFFPNFLRGFLFIPASSYSAKSVEGNFLIRVLALAQYSGDSSIPMNRRPRLFAATAVVPLPMKGSRITSAVVERMIRSMSATGNGAGCSLLVS